ncbi:hypothetical protein [Wandonia haliotis]
MNTLCRPFGLFPPVFLMFLILLSCDSSNEDLLTKASSIYDSQMSHKEHLIEMNRIDSLHFYTNIADSLFEKKKLKEGINFLDSALNFANYNDEIKILKERVVHLVSLKRYEAAIEDYSTLIKSEEESKDYYFERAICYKNRNEIPLAVDDLRKAIRLGHEEADKLHNKINPIRKRISYYVTRCCDGTTSNSTGRGTCSHHGGVCNWSEPVYEEYRKY